MNDFKRMWTREEVKDTYYLHLYIEDETREIDEKTFNSIKTYNRVAIYDDTQNWVYYHLVSTSKGSNAALYVFTSDYEVLLVRNEYNEYTIQQTRRELISHDVFEQLVKSTPTAVSIIEDQGKLELMLEHDGEVLEVNDTPNQFLQRRLDKPSAEWNSETSETDLASWLEEQLPNMYVGQFLTISDSSGDLNIFCIVKYLSNDVLETTPLGVKTYRNGFIEWVQFDPIDEKVFIKEHDNTDSFIVPFNNMGSIKIF